MDQSKCFASGPCAKRSSWNLDYVSDSLLGRSHRSKTAISQIQELTQMIRDVLQIPDSYFVALTPGSTTGSVESGLWNLLGDRVSCIVFDIFAQHWYNDIKHHLKIDNTQLISTVDWEVPDCGTIDFSRDVVFVYAATTTARMFDNLDWIPNNRSGLTFCDAASAAFAVKLNWEKLDVTSFGFQKGLACEANQGVIVLSPQAMKRFLNIKNGQCSDIYKLRSIPRVIRMNPEMFNGYTINTPSMLCISEYIDALKWAAEIGGLEKLNHVCTANKEKMDHFINSQTTFRYICKNPKHQSITNSCLEFNNKENTWQLMQQLVDLIEEKNVGYDILGHTLWQPCIRIWHGPTVKLEALTTLLNQISAIRF